VQICDRFQFHQSRKVSDLAERWHEITDHLESEDQEAINRMRLSSKTHRPQSWTYPCEPPADLPPLAEMLEEYRQMPSPSFRCTVFTMQGD
jgi:hypothetical protein